FWASLLFVLCWAGIFFPIGVLPCSRLSVLRRSTKLSSVNASLLSHLADLGSAPASSVSAEPQADTRTPPASAAAIATPTRVLRVIEFSWIVFWKSPAAKGSEYDLRKTVMCMDPESYVTSSLRKHARVLYAAVTGMRQMIDSAANQTIVTQLVSLLGMYRGLVGSVLS